MFGINYHSSGTRLDGTPRGWVYINGIGVTRETVGQYTGLKDVKGKMIFEGDIVSKYSNNSGKRIIKQVVFESGMFFWKYSEDAGLPLCDVSDKCEVIGNIYDNPEPLKGASDA